MSQSRVMSLVEVATSSLIGFVVSIFTNWAVLPIFGMYPSFHQSFWITLVFMVISIIRSYLVRRFFAAYVERFASWCQDLYDDFVGLRSLT
jgi:ABC-type sugar transport system permease subunit